MEHLGLLCSEPNGCQLDHAGSSREAPNGRKRRGRIPTLSPKEKRMKKIEADRSYRKNHKDEFDKLRAIASRFGGVEKMEQEINEMEAELYILCNLQQQDYHGMQSVNFNNQVKEEAQQLARIFETVGAFKVKRKGGKGKLIFGSVTAQDLVDIIKTRLQRDADKRVVSLPEIRETGEYITELKLHPEVTARVRLNVYAN